MITFNVRLTEPSNEVVTALINVTNANIDNYGFGKEIQLSTSTVTISAGKLVPDNQPTLMIRNINAVSLDRLITISLSDPSENAKVNPYSRIYIWLIDDGREYLIDVTNPGYNLKPLVADGMTDNSVLLQGLIDYCNNNLANKRIVFYFPKKSLSYRLWNLKRISPGWTFMGDYGRDNYPTIKRADMPKLESPISIFRAVDYPVIYQPKHGRSINQKLVFSGISQQDWTALNGYVPNGMSYTIHAIIDADHYSLASQSGGTVNTSGYSSDYNGSSNPFTSVYWLRNMEMISPAGNLWNNAHDSPTLGFRNMIFDGNTDQIMPYLGFQAAQCHLIILDANPANSGKLTASLQDCLFNNGPGDGIEIYRQTKADLYNITCTDIFRAGWSVVGGNNIINVKDYIGQGTVSQSGMDVEVDASGAGYNNSYQLTMALTDCAFLSGDFDYGPRGDNNSLTANNVRVYPAANIGATKQIGFDIANSGNNDNASFTNCILYGGCYNDNPPSGGGYHFVRGPGKYTFTETNFYISGFAKNDGTLPPYLSAVKLGSTLTGSAIFDKCYFGIDNIYRPPSLTVKSYGLQIYKNIQGNVYINSCFFDSRLTTHDIIF